MRPGRPAGCRTSRSARSAGGCAARRRARRRRAACAVSARRRKPGSAGGSARATCSSGCGLRRLRRAGLGLRSLRRARSRPPRPARRSCRVRTAAGSPARRALRSLRLAVLVGQLGRGPAAAGPGCRRAAGRTRTGGRSSLLPLRALPGGASSSSGLGWNIGKLRAEEQRRRPPARGRRPTAGRPRAARWRCRRRSRPGSDRRNRNESHGHEL